MSYQRVEIRYQFKLDSYVKIGAGFGKNSFVDNAFRLRKDAQNNTVYDIPGTSVKGRIRANFEQLVHLLPANYTTSIFGDEGKQGWAHFSSLTPQQQARIGMTTSTSIDRFRKAARHNALRVEEYAQLAKDDAFVGTIEGFTPETPHMKQELYALLTAVLTTTYFGSDKSTGYGKGAMELLAVTINEEPLDLTTIRETILQQLV